MNQPYPGQYPAQYPPQQPPALTAQDESNLNVLGVLFFVYAGMIGIGALALSAFAVLPAMLISGAAAGTRPPPGAPPPMLVGGIFAALFGIFALLLAVKCVILILAARALGRRQHYVLVMIGACASLFTFPLGTALGVCTILMLQRPAVKVAFGMA
jgi:hypothetical protein